MRSRVLRATGAVAAAAVTAGLALLLPATAEATTSGSWYYQQASTKGGVGSYAHFGLSGDVVLVGDWDGDGKDSYAVRRGSTYYVSNSPRGGATSYSFRYGSASDVVLVGDWNGDGKDTLGVRRGNTFYLSDSTRGGVANRVFKYGNGSDVVLVGDWNGDGRDTLGVRRGYTYYFSNVFGGVAQQVAHFGSSNDVVISGDWNGDRKDTLAVRRANTYYLTNRVGGGATDVVEKFGTSADSAYVGDWNRDRVDTLAVRRPYGPPRTFSGNGSYRVPSQVPAGLYRSSAPANDMCYWERVSDFTGSLDSILANDLESDMSPVYAQVQPGDAGFNTDGCGTWTEARSNDPVRYLTLDNGQYRVGYDMRPGRYQATGGADCYWETVSDFSGAGGSIIANDFGARGPIVDVPSGTAGFTTDSCGTWTRVGDAFAGAALRQRVTVAPHKATRPADFQR